MLSHNIVTYVAAVAIPAGSRVKFVAGSAISVTLAGAQDIEIGTAILHSGRLSYPAGTAVGVKLMNDSGTRTCVATTALTAGQLVRRAAAGQVDDTAGVGDPFGYACEVAAAGEFVEVLTIPGMTGEAGAGLGFLRTATGVFDTAATDDASISNLLVGSHGIGVTIPSGAIITGGFVEVNTAFTSGGSATISIGTLQGASVVDIKAATAFMTPAGLYSIIPKSSTPESTGIILTADRTITVAVATAALTAGKMTVVLNYAQGS